MKSLRACGIIATALCIVIIDGWFKYIAITRFPTSGSRVGVFNLVLHKNPGIAFDIPISLWVVAPLTIVICLWLATFATRHWKHQKAAAVCALVVIIGALGNLIDRLINGFTTDYLLLFTTTAINLADVLIVIGIFCLLWYTRDKKAS